MTQREFVLCACMRDALADVFALAPADIARVRIVQRSRFARLHGPRVAATTRVGTIYLAGSGRRFADDPELVLHEYFHVLRQWNTGSLTVWRYLREAARTGYHRNRYEVEACAFARHHMKDFAMRSRPTDDAIA